jgi:hypothetical protein
MYNLNDLNGKIVTINKYIHFLDEYISFPARILGHKIGNLYHFLDKNENLYVEFIIELLDDYDYKDTFDGFEEEDFLDLYDAISEDNIYKSNLTII